MNVAPCQAFAGSPLTLVRLSLDPNLPSQVFTAPVPMPIAPRAWYVVSTPEGERLARAEAFPLPILPSCAARAAGSVERPAGEAELRRAEELGHLERDALAFCRARAAELGLAMRPVTAVIPLDRDVLYMTFAAEERVDFRELLRDLGRRTRRRVELRQIGVRDQAKASGGWGPCGATLCCSTFMARFTSVTIRMAKAQNLSLSPSRISGMCGRLMCCLAHEAPEPQVRPRQDAARSPALPAR